MSLLPENRNAEADRSPLENDRTPTYTSTGNVTAAPTHTLSGSDSVRLPDETKSESSLTDTLIIADLNYIYYRIYAEDGAIPSKTPVTPSDPFLGRIKAISVPPPHTANALKRSIAKVENIKDRTSTSLFLTPYAQSPMGDADKVTILNRTGLGSTPEEALALVAKMSDSERSALESGGRSGLASAAEPDSSSTTPAEIRYLYYLLYADDYEMLSKVAIDPEKPSLGRIRTDSVAPPHSPASIKRCISRVEKTPAIAHADLYADLSCHTPLKEGHISIFRSDSPGLNLNKPMAIVQMPIVQVKTPSIPDGKYLIKNRAVDVYWCTGYDPFTTVHFWLWAPLTEKSRYSTNYTQWDITHDTTGNIFMKSLDAPSSWVGAKITASSVPVPWRLIPADSKFYYLTTDVNHVSQSPRVPTAQPGSFYSESQVTNPSGLMTTLEEGNQLQMWEFIRI